MPTRPSFSIPDTYSISSNSVFRDEPTPGERIRTLPPETVHRMILNRENGDYRVVISSLPPSLNTLTVMLNNWEVLETFADIRPDIRESLDRGAAHECNFARSEGRWMVSSRTPHDVQPDAAPAPRSDTHGFSNEDWEALPQAAKDRMVRLADEVRNFRVRARNAERATTRLQNQFDEERESARIMRAARDTAIIKLAAEEQKAARLTERITRLKQMLGSTNVLRTTAVVWRDATKGSAAKLRAFKDFCTALDSLPAEQDTEADFPLAG